MTFSVKNQYDNEAAVSQNRGHKAPDVETAPGDIFLSCRVLPGNEFVRVRLAELTDKGLCFESGTAFLPGQTLQILVVDYPLADIGPAGSAPLRSNALAEVATCQAAVDSVRQGYRVWVKYFLYD